MKLLHIFKNQVTTFSGSQSIVKQGGERFNLTRMLYMFFECVLFLWDKMESVGGWMSINPLLFWGGLGVLYIIYSPKGNFTQVQQFFISSG